MKEYLFKIKYSRFICFYTIWAMFLHILYLKGYIGNTFPIALFVCICSQVIAFINPKYPYFLPFEFLFHFLPLLIIPVSFENVNYLVYSFLLYLLVINTNSLKVYLNPVKFLIK
jgi:hypothetical protein